MSKKRRDQLIALLDQAWGPVDGGKPTRLRLVSSQEQPLAQLETQLADLHKAMSRGEPSEQDAAFKSLLRIKWPERYNRRAKLAAIPGSSYQGASA